MALQHFGALHFRASHFYPLSHATGAEEYKWDTSQGATHKWLKFHPNKKDVEPVVPEVIAVSDVADVFKYEEISAFAKGDLDHSITFAGRVAPFANAYVVPVGETSYLRLADIQPTADNSATLATGELISKVYDVAPFATAVVEFGGIDLVTALPVTTPKGIKNPSDAEILAMALALFTSRQRKQNAGVNPIKTSTMQTLQESIYAKYRRR
jgi:hypothetical protein